MGDRGRRVGPTWDTLVLTVQPWPDRTTYSVIRRRHDGAATTIIRVASGVIPLTPAELDAITPAALLDRVAGLLRPPAQQPAPPLGAMGGQLTLDLALKP